MSEVVVARAHRRLGVATAGGRLQGFVSSHGRAAGLVWDVDYLRCHDVSSATELLMWACDQALRARARRVFVETPPEGTGAEAARRAGFERYSFGAVLRVERGFPRVTTDVLGARPRLSSDEHGLFQLYSAAVPANVRWAEAMTQEEWAALYPGRKLWTPSVFGDRDDYVWEMSSRLIGWMRVVFGQKSQLLDMLVHPLYDAYADRMVAHALVQMSAKVPVVASMREYQGGALSALERAGFHRIGTYVAWVRQLATRVEQPSVGAIRAPATPSV
jgi:hypothetical protein